LIGFLKSSHILCKLVGIVVYYAHFASVIEPWINHLNQPLSQNISLTQNTTFMCSAFGYRVDYNWKIGSGSFPNKVIGINTSTLVIPDVKSSDDNTYFCVASNEGGKISSNGAKLTVTGMTMFGNLSSDSVNVALMVQVYQRWL